MNQRDETAGERWRNIALGAGIGGAVGAVAEPAARGLSNLLQRLRKPTQEAAPAPQLLLPLGKAINERAGLTGGYVQAPATIQVAEEFVRPRGAKYVRPGASRVANPAEEQLKRVYQIAEQTGLPPGREYEALQDIWSSIAPPNAGSLDELVEQATRQHPLDEIMQSAKNRQQKMEQSGISPLQGLPTERYTRPVTEIVTDEPTFVLRGGPLVPAGPVTTNKGRISELIGTLRAEKQGKAPAEAKQDPLAFLFGKERINSSPAPATGTSSPSIASVPATDIKHVFNINPGKMKDISGAAAYGNDVYRNFKNVFGEDYPAIKEKVLDPFDASKKSYTDMQKYWVDKLQTEVVKKLGITKDSKLSALVQQFGEGEISLDKLKAITKDWEKVVEADKWFRQAYDALLDQVNATRARIYPNNPDKLVPKRNDYYRHFQEFSGLTGLKNMFDTPAQIDPKLVGTSEFTLPKS
ncbi:hypothetical protein [Brevibacillus sp. H7]|uniref:hypothetical protein n=1 Tax=Brevibacillus sp. H7 TaxID=3349138 RepID=UPI003822808A